MPAVHKALRGHEGVGGAHGQDARRPQRWHDEPPAAAAAAATTTASTTDDPLTSTTRDGSSSRLDAGADHPSGKPAPPISFSKPQPQ